MLLAIKSSSLFRRYPWSVFVSTFRHLSAALRLHLSPTTPVTSRTKPTAQLGDVLSGRSLLRFYGLCHASDAISAQSVHRSPGSIVADWKLTTGKLTISTGLAINTEGSKVENEGSRSFSTIIWEFELWPCGISIPSCLRQSAPLSSTLATVVNLSSPILSFRPF